jgi:alkyl sulfatase BDS1-like metallo-beta-lactamase superfamily hydrolase
MRYARHAIAVCLLSATVPAGAQGIAPRDAEPAVRAAQAKVLQSLPFADRQDFADADRGFVATLPDALIAGPGARPAWSLKEYAFLQKSEAPATVNPSLWRQSQLNLRNGLYKVTEGVYQLRGFDLANMTIVEGRSGIIVIDPLLVMETAKAGLELYFAHRPRKPVVAVIYTHSHADHWGGVKGVLDEAEVAAGRAVVIAPAGFMEHAVAENIIAGNAMSRRAHYQFGPLLPKGERQQVDAGLGKTLASGSITLIPPTDVIVKDVEKRSVDGVEIVFQLAPGTEAPAEFHLYFPQFKALDMAENVTHNQHNLLPLRGAEVRDAQVWSRVIGEAVERFGGEAEVLLAQHHWPVWGRERVAGMLRQQRDLYKYLHDQTLRLMNHGLTAAEIAERIELPASLASQWHARGYYGSLRHNVKAIYQKYLGWYDANPANLDPLPPAEAARKALSYMGGADAVLRRAREDFAKGEYRWVAQVMSQAVFADPSNRDARVLAADAFEQLGYLAESATWRNAYLVGAWELRNGMPQVPVVSPVTPDTLRALKLDMFFDYLGVRLNGPKAEGKRMVINWRFTDVKQDYILNLENSALTYVSGRQALDADATLTLEKATLDEITLRRTTFPAQIMRGRIQVEGSTGKLSELFSLMDNFAPMFEIVEPVSAAAR